MKTHKDYFSMHELIEHNATSLEILTQAAMSALTAAETANESDRAALHAKAKSCLERANQVAAALRGRLSGRPVSADSGTKTAGNVVPFPGSTS